MKLVFTLLILIFSSSSFAATEFQLVWDKDKLPFEIKVAQSAGTNLSLVGQMGILKDESKLPPLKPMTDGKITLDDGEAKLILLLVKNTSKKKYRFSVAPHSTTPGESAFGFVFQCLCNGHVYEVGPQETWYRWMKLTFRKSETKDPVILKHVVFEVTSSRKPQAHHHQD